MEKEKNQLLTVKGKIIKEEWNSEEYH